MQSVYIFDKSVSLSDCAIKAFSTDECRFSLNSELIDVEDRFRIFRLSGKTYIVKKSKIQKARVEIEKALQAQNKVDDLLVEGKKLRVVVPKLVEWSDYGLLVSEYLGHTLQEMVYARNTKDINLNVEFLFAVLKAFLNANVLYRGFLPRNTIVKGNTLYLIDWEDAIFYEGKQKPYISLMWETNFVLNWGYFFDQDLINETMRKLCVSKEKEQSFPLLEYELEFQRAMNIIGDNRIVREKIKEVVLFAEKETNISAKHIPVNDLAHLISDLFDAYVDVFFDISSYYVRKEDEMLYSNIIILISQLIHFCHEEGLPIQPIAMVGLLSLIDDNPFTLDCKSDFYSALQNINSEIVRHYIDNNPKLKEILNQRLLKLFSRDAAVTDGQKDFINNLVATIVRWSAECNEFLESKKFDWVFATDAKRATQTIANLLNTLANATSKYTNPDKALLDGKVMAYKGFLDDENIAIDGINEQEVIEQLSRYFQRAVQWGKAETMINITPPANLVSIACSAYANLFNPNFAQDEPSGYLLATELAVVKMLAQLVGWDVKKAGGLFTFGGKGICLYAGKLGLQKSVPSARDVGINNGKAIIVSNDKGHPCHVEVSDWLGLGRNSCIRLSTDADGRLSLVEFESLLEEKIQSGNKIACIMINGGTTNEVIVDPIKKVFEIRNKLVKKFSLDYYPHIHVDSVIGWAWLFYQFYDFNKNELKMSKSEQSKIASIKEKIMELRYADSFGVDFHKTGFCPYISSCIMVKDGGTLQALGGKAALDIDTLKLGEYSPFEYSLELSRPSNGPISAYSALKLFGAKGFQELVFRVFSNGEFIRSLLNKEKDFEVINNDTEGFATLFVIHPPGENLRYGDYIKLEEPKVSKLLEYNHQFFLFLLEKYEEGVIGFRMTFSKSYKPYGAKVKTGCLKIYQASPIATKEKIRQIICQVIQLKKEFDKTEKVLVEQINRPIDFVYRGDENESNHNS